MTEVALISLLLTMCAMQADDFLGGRVSHDAAAAAGSQSGGVVAWQGHAGQFERPHAHRLANAFPPANTLSSGEGNGGCWALVSWLLTTATTRGSVPLFHQANIGPPELPWFRSQFSVSSSSPPPPSPTSAPIVNPCWNAGSSALSMSPGYPMLLQTGRLFQLSE